MPGESVSMRAGHVFINGERLNEPYLQHAYRVVRLTPLGRRHSRPHHRAG